jgi:hypothetical protein
MGLTQTGWCSCNASVTCFSVPKLTLDHPKRMLRVDAIDRSQYPLAQIVVFNHMPKAQNGAFIRHEVDAYIELDKLAIHWDVMQGHFHCRVEGPEELLLQMDAKHHLCGKRRATRFASRCFRGNQVTQVRPRNYQNHLVQEFTLADKLESDCGKAEVFQLKLTHEALNWVTFANHA